MVEERMKISLIVAVAENNVIGKDNDLIWRLPKDMQYFKKTTLNHHVVTGRKNYVSIPKKYRPLSERVNIVLTRDASWEEEGCVVFNNLELAIEYALGHGEKELFIIGGGQVYNEVLEKNMVDKMYITRVHHQFEGDTFFPDIDLSTWNLVGKEYNQKDAKHPYAFTFEVYEKE